MAGIGLPYMPELTGGFPELFLECSAEMLCICKTALKGYLRYGQVCFKEYPGSLPEFYDPDKILY